MKENEVITTNKYSSNEPRIFLAVPFEDSFKRQVIRYQAALKNTFQAVHWIPIENLHLTLKFFGETKLEKVERILSELGSLLSEFKVHNIYFNDFGYFGTPRYPRVLFLKGESEPLIKLAESVLKRFPDKNFRPFRPHLTLGKFLKRQSQEEIEHNEKLLRAWQSGLSIDLGLPKVEIESQVAEVTLMETIFVGRAVKYEIRHKFSLKSK